MRKPERTVLALMAAVLMVFVLGAVSVPAHQDPAPAQSPAPAQGELIQVDTDKMTLSVQTADGPMQFQYTDRTEVTGAQESIAGLASASKQRVIVHFTVEQDIRTATRIEVLPAQ